MQTKEIEKANKEEKMNKLNGVCRIATQLTLPKYFLEFLRPQNGCSEFMCLICLIHLDENVCTISKIVLKSQQQQQE